MGVGSAHSVKNAITASGPANRAGARATIGPCLVPAFA
jgi:hypothetical protein